MWGWLIILVGTGRSFDPTKKPSPAKRPWRNALALVLATFLLASQLVGFTGWQTLPVFLAAAILSLILHIALRHSVSSS